jgi:hypothetical protein
MKFIGALLFTMIAAWLAATPAAATTVDFSGQGTADGDAVSYIVNSEAVFNFATASDFSLMGFITPNVRYRQTADYSGDQALYTASDGGVFLLGVDAKPGVVFTSFTFDFGSQPNQSHVMQYAVATWPGRDPIGSGVSFVSGTTGGLLTFSGLNLTGILLQFGTSQNVGLRSLSYTTAAVTATPIPGTLVLFGTGLAGLGTLARRKRGATKAAILPN